MARKGRSDEGKKDEDTPKRFSEDDVPHWREELSFRGQPYRKLDHQHGMMGWLSVRLVAASELARIDWDVLSPLPVVGGSELRPYLEFHVGKSSGRSQVAHHGGSDPTWQREQVEIEVFKDQLAAGKAIFLDVQASTGEKMAQSLVSGAMKAVMGGQGAVLGVGTLDITGLMRGETELLDVWVELQPKGRVHILVEYHPKGLIPTRHDIVYTERFVRWPDSLVIPPREPLEVLETKGPYALVTYQAPQGTKCKIRLHRSWIFVIERFSWWDNTVKFAGQPIDAALDTDAGRWCKRKARPYLHSISVIAAPLLASATVAITTARVTIAAAWAGTTAVAKASFND
ncbi:unnamed protein product [Chrysoparadoxa australica]